MALQPRYPNETNGIYDYDQAAKVRTEAHDFGSVDWADPRLVSIDRMRMLTDPGFPMWDISYCYGTVKLEDGSYSSCLVVLPFYQLTKGKWWSEIKEYAAKDGVNIYKLQLWHAVSKLW